MEEKGMKKKKKLLRLFIETFYLSAFTFGGGYMIVSLMNAANTGSSRWLLYLIMRLRITWQKHMTDGVVGN